MVEFVLFLFIIVSANFLRGTSEKKHRNPPYGISDDQRTELVLFNTRVRAADRLQKKYDRVAARNQDGQLSFEAPDRDSGILSLKKKK